MGTIVNQSNVSDDNSSGPAIAVRRRRTTSAAERKRTLRIRSSLAASRVSPWAKSNFIDDTITDQSSILRFIEDNWELGRIAERFDRCDARASGQSVRIFTTDRERDA